MPSQRIVTFLTDFGLHDTFVGQMKGAALAVHSDLLLVDLTHEVPAHDVAAGAYLLWTGYGSFPPGTIHVAVVDPGVGTPRRGIVVRTGRHVFVAPDNGVLSRVLADDPAEAAYALEAAHYRRASASATFEGRDVFAPAAAWVARGTELHHFGPPAGDLVTLATARPVLRPGTPTRVRVLVVDRFGNATLDIRREDLASILPSGATSPRLTIDTPGGPVSSLVGTYAEGAPGHPFALFNSAGHLEIALREARASDALGLHPGLDVTFSFG